MPRPNAISYCDMVKNRPLKDFDGFDKSKDDLSIVIFDDGSVKKFCDLEVEKDD